MFDVEPGNDVTIEGTARVCGEVRGRRNVIRVTSAAPVCDVRVQINGDDNLVELVDTGGDGALIGTFPADEDRNAHYTWFLCIC